MARKIDFQSEHSRNQCFSETVNSQFIEGIRLNNVAHFQNRATARKRKVHNVMQLTEEKQGLN